MILSPGSRDNKPELRLQNYPMRAIQFSCKTNLRVFFQWRSKCISGPDSANEAYKIRAAARTGLLEWIFAVAGLGMTSGRFWETVLEPAQVSGIPIANVSEHVEEAG
jgi:hypothetical protein